MVRRTKEQVAADLPPKQEQVLEIELHPSHRAIYDTHLQRERQKILGLLDDVDKNRFTILQSLTLLRQLSLDVSLVDEESGPVPSAKVDALVEQLDDVIAGGHRALIFSQFTGFLGSVRNRLDEERIPYSYLDGSTRNRGEVLEEFKSGAVPPVFLISLKAGGFGLNLTEPTTASFSTPGGTRPPRHKRSTVLTASGRHETSWSTASLPKTPSKRRSWRSKPRSRHCSRMSWTPKAHWAPDSTPRIFARCSSEVPIRSNRTYPLTVM